LDRNNRSHVKNEKAANSMSFRERSGDSTQNANVFFYKMAVSKVRKPANRKTVSYMS
jgi:hypothetical protein